ncbi:MAG: hypothetical protein O7I42_17185 [Alphaproteobacteria bacterium]|nr:hypothetical protein [Alphaproteobacteria bacterium]
MHLLSVGLGDVQDVQNQKRPRPDPGTALAQDRRAQMRAQLWPARLRDSRVSVLASTIVSSSARPISRGRGLRD